jgi:hypothetical protein
MIRRTAIGIIGVLALVSGCSNGNTSGTPTPTPSSSTDSTGDSSAAPSSSEQSLPFAGAPKVSNPLPASVLAGDPCADALTPEQITQALGAQVQGESNAINRIGPSCEWFNRDTTGKVTVTYVTETHVGLSGVYQNSRPGDSSWKELPLIQGFPAVAHNKVTSSCQVSVGLADDLSIDVTTHLGSSKGGGQSDPCEVAPQVANLVVTTLKKKAGA